MNILITGGTGFIGQSLCKQLLQHNHSLIVLTRDIAKAQKIVGHTSQLISCLAEISPSVKIDAIINLAGAPIADKRWTLPRKKELEQSRVDLTAEIIALIHALEQKPEVLISGSAASNVSNAFSY